MSTNPPATVRPKIFAFLLVTIFGSIWWMGEARAKIDRARHEAAAYQYPLPVLTQATLAAEDGGGAYDGEVPPPIHRLPRTFAIFSDADFASQAEM